MGPPPLRQLSVAARLRYGPFGVDVAGRTTSASAPMDLTVSYFI